MRQQQQQLLVLYKKECLFVSLFVVSNQARLNGPGKLADWEPRQTATNFQRLALRAAATMDASDKVSSAPRIINLGPGSQLNSVQLSSGHCSDY